MQRQIESRRSQKWLQRNDLENSSCCYYVSELCKYKLPGCSFNIAQYNGRVALWLTYGLNSYIIYVCEEEVTLHIDLLKSNNNITQLNRIFYGDACWAQCFDWVKTRM